MPNYLVMVKTPENSAPHCEATEEDFKKACAKLAQLMALHEDDGVECWIEPETTQLFLK